MRTGSFVVLFACVALSSARAERAVEPSPKAATPKRVEPRDKAVKAADKAAGKKKPPARPDASAAELARLTDDPLVGKADRITGEEARHVVAFTFDDGPNPDTTPAVIDALEKYNVPATFFIVTRRLLGKHGEKPRELLGRMLASGFLVASHSVSHPDLKGASAKKLAAEVDNSIRTLAKEAKRPIGLFRAPFGSLDGNGRAWLKRRGLTEARWSVDTLDWQAKNADRLRKKVFSMIVKQDGGVVLMHDVKPITAKVIADVLDDLEAENCRRLEAKDPKRSPIIPVSIHYFLRDAKKPRPIPPEVEKRTEAYKAALPGRCAARPKPAPAPKAK